MSIQQALALLSSYVPFGIAASGLSKISPNLKSFISSAVAGGYSMNEVLGFLRKKLESPGIETERGKLEEGKERGMARPDELASLQRMKQQERGPKLIGNLATAAATLGTPFALKALQGENSGIEEVKQEPQEQPEAARRPSPSTPSANFIAKHPELGAYLDEKIASGMQPRDAALDAKAKRKFKSSIDQIESDMGQMFEDLISGLFGQARPTQSPAASTSQPSSKQAHLAALLQQLRQIRGKG